MILNPNKTKALVVSSTGTLLPVVTLTLPMVTWSWLGSICASLNLDILGVKFDSRLTFEDHARGIVSHVSQRIGILSLVKRVFVDTSALLRCYYAFVLPVLEYCSPVWGSAAEYHLQLVVRQVYSVARLRPDQTFLSSFHRRHVVVQCMLHNVNSNSNHCLSNELLSEFHMHELRLQLIH